MIAASKQWNDKVHKAEEVEALWDEYDLGNRTFGKLISEMKALYDFSEEDIIELKTVLKQRNYIAHDYFRFNAELFYSDSGQKRMIKDFIDFQHKANSLDKILRKYLKLYIDKMGLTEDYFAGIMQQMEEEWSKKVIDENHKTYIE